MKKINSKSSDIWERLGGQFDTLTLILPAVLHFCDSDKHKKEKHYARDMTKTTQKL